MLDLNELNPDHCLSIYFETPVTENLAIDINSKIGLKKGHIIGTNEVMVSAIGRFNS